MTTYLSEHAAERGTYILNMSFVDSLGSAVAPNPGATWMLTDVGGNVINSRSAVALGTAASATIVLSGADLAIGTHGRERVLTVLSNYSSSLGTALPLNQEVRFYIDDMVNV